MSPVDSILNFCQHWRHEKMILMFCQSNGSVTNISTRHQHPSSFSATSMLLMDVGDETCWWHFWDYEDGILQENSRSLDFKLFQLLENFLEKLYPLNSISFLLEVAEMFLKGHCWVCDLSEAITLEFFNFRKCWWFLFPNFLTNGCSKTG